ncbi:hypothetical protein XU18_4300 [Perkinsela sp. CCAP 1560/4]|nr:hypothetical protein XU18_4300 [Perkinsela sp. CCAP 1560/4]|eukprot:KNH04441.1 hypothetical protein XU18_4300 [Perkinsela sp. CCAP 1560/4]
MIIQIWLNGQYAVVSACEARGDEVHKKEWATASSVDMNTVESMNSLIKPQLGRKAGLGQRGTARWCAQTERQRRTHYVSHIPRYRHLVEAYDAFRRRT